MDEHFENLEQVFNRLSEAGLKLKPQKYIGFLGQQVLYLGHVISANGASPDKRKTEAIEQIPVLKMSMSCVHFCG